MEIYGTIFKVYITKKMIYFQPQEYFKEYFIITLILKLYDNFKL